MEIWNYKVLKENCFNFGILLSTSKCFKRRVDLTFRFYKVSLDIIRTSRLGLLVIKIFEKTLRGFVSQAKELN